MHLQVEVLAMEAVAIAPLVLGPVKRKVGGIIIASGPATSGE